MSCDVFSSITLTTAHILSVSPTCLLIIHQQTSFYCLTLSRYVRLWVLYALKSTDMNSHWFTVRYLVACIVWMKTFIFFFLPMLVVKTPRPRPTVYSIDNTSPAAPSAAQAYTPRLQLHCVCVCVSQMLKCWIVSPPASTKSSCSS